MSIMLLNPTNENFDEMMWGGRGFPLPSGEKMKVDDACGNHLLNAYGPKGLCSLEFGDQEETVAELGRKRNMSFKKRQISVHNQSNIARRQQGLPFRIPSPTIIKYAEELGVTLEEPYTPQSKGDGRISALEDTVASLTRMVSAFIESSMGDRGKTEVDTPTDTEPPIVIPRKEKAK